MSVLQRLPLALVAFAFLSACAESTGPQPSPIGAPAQMILISGNDQIGAVATVLPLPLVVRVVDALGAGVPDITVAWSAGAGTLSAASTATNALGHAHIEWRLGTQTGQQSATATVAGLAVVTFVATATPAAPARIERVRGDGQTGTAGAMLPDTLVVQVSDAHGNPTAGATVSWLVTTGNGTITPVTPSTDAAGLARAVWMLGTTLGQHTVSAGVAGAGAVTFSATTTVGEPANLEKVSGDEQEATAGAALPQPFVVRLTDVGGNAVAGPTVTWGVAGGGSIAPQSGVTDVQGLASAVRILNTLAGENLATASAAGLSVTFRATGMAGPAARLEKLSGDGQTGKVALPLPDSLAVAVVDQHGNPVTGVPVTWAVAAGGGSVDPTAGESGGAGVIRTRWTLGTAVGVHSAHATVTGLPIVIFIATGQPGTVSNLEKISGDAQVATVGSVLPNPLVVRARDTHGNPVPGAAVQWRVTGGGSIAPPTSATDAAGTAQAIWTLGTTAGTDTVTAVVGQATVGFVATGSPGPTDTVSVSPDSVFVAIGGTSQLSAVVVDAFGNPITGRLLTWTSASPAIATVSETGLVTGVAAGVTTITAASEGRQGAAHVMVQPPIP